MTAKGRKGISLSDLINDVGDNSPVDGASVKTAQAATTAASLDDLIANPRNPREDVGDLSDLSTIAVEQLQPALVVTAAAYLKLYPEDEKILGAAKWVVINGNRRLAAARLYGRVDLEIVVKDRLAGSRALLLAVSIIENVDREDFGVIEEAKAVETLVAECGSANAAAEQLGKSKGWVSQRRSLLKLVPELQDALRRGDLAVRLARSLAQVPLEEQVERWQAEQNPPADEPVEDEPDSGKQNGKQASKPVDAPRITKALKKWSATPPTLAEALRSYFDADQLRVLVAALTGD